MDQADLMRLARYNAWQNGLMHDEMALLPASELAAARGAFFGSILATANHLLWADAMWLSRFTDSPRPEGGIAQSVALTADLAQWYGARRAVDDTLLAWARDIAPDELGGDLRWWSGATGAAQQLPRAQCLAHMFNHQTHHRGQIHAMITAAGGKGWVSDLVFMPGD